MMKLAGKSNIIKASQLSILNSYRKQPLHFLIIVGIVAITITKLSLVGKGLLSFPDEFRYTAAEKTLKDLSAFNFSGACNAIFSTKSKPGDVILSTIPNAVQQLTGYISGMYCYDSRNSYPLFIFNFFIYCLILLVHYKFSKLILKDDFLALVSVLIFGSLTNSYMYLRHVLAYDTSLLIFYWFIYKTVKYTASDENLSFKKSALIGLCSFFGYLVYPGYFPLFFLCIFLFFFNGLTKQYFFKRVLHGFYFALGSIYCLLVFEIMSRIGDSSYTDDALHASGIVKQGSPEESFLFIFKYLFEVEHLGGILVIICIPLFFFTLLHILIKNRQENILILLLGIAVAGLFIAYASIGYFFDNFYLMGRSLHDFYPFICIFSVFSIQQLILLFTKKQKFVLIMISLVFVLSFVTKFVDYLSISYPRDVYWRLGQTVNLNTVATVCEYANGWSVNPGEKEYYEYLSKHPQNKGSANNPGLVVVNGCFYYPVNDMTVYHAYAPEKGYTLMETTPHYLNFKAYQFEGPTIAERKNIDQINFQIKIYSKANQ